MTKLKKKVINKKMLNIKFNLTKKVKSLLKEKGVDIKSIQIYMEDSGLCWLPVKELKKVLSYANLADVLNKYTSGNYYNKNNERIVPIYELMDMLEKSSDELNKAVRLDLYAFDQRNFEKTEEITPKKVKKTCISSHGSAIDECCSKDNVSKINKKIKEAKKEKAVVLVSSTPFTRDIKTKDVFYVNFNGKEVPCFKNSEGTYFQADTIVKDILGIKNVSDTVNRHCKGESMTAYIYHKNMRVEYLFISEKGLSKLLLNSKKEVAKKFRDHLIENKLFSDENNSKFINRDKNDIILFETDNGYIMPTPETYKEAITALSSVAELYSKAVRLCKEFKPKVEYSDKVTDNGKFMTMKEFGAQVSGYRKIKIGINNLYVLLRYLGYVKIEKKYDPELNGWNVYVPASKGLTYFSVVHVPSYDRVNRKEVLACKLVVRESHVVRLYNVLTRELDKILGEVKGDVSKVFIYIKNNMKKNI